MKATVPAELIEGPVPKLLKVGPALSAMRVKVYCARAAGAVKRAKRAAPRMRGVSFMAQLSSAA